MSNFYCNKKTGQTISVGDVFSRWTVIAIGSVRPFENIKCRCACGTERATRAERLLSGRSGSCGCLRDDNLTTHGLTKTSIRESSHEYWVWNAMVQRCTNPNDRGYMNYGGRGITVHPNWHKFEGFDSDMGKRPGKGYSLERKDNDKGYGPANCQWQTRKEQNRNKRNNRIIRVNGEERCLQEWAERLGVGHTTILLRLRAGWTAEKAVTTPTPRQRKAQAATVH